MFVLIKLGWDLTGSGRCRLALNIACGTCSSFRPDPHGPEPVPGPLRLAMAPRLPGRTGTGGPEARGRGRSAPGRGRQHYAPTQRVELWLPGAEHLCGQEGAQFYKR